MKKIRRNMTGVIFDFIFLFHILAAQRPCSGARGHKGWNEKRKAFITASSGAICSKVFHILYSMLL